MGWAHALRWRRIRALRAALAMRTDDPMIRAWLDAPLPDPGTRFEELPLLAVDLELTGLDPVSDSILSIGWVPIDGGRIQLAGAAHHLVAHDAGVGQSARIHGILDHEAEGGDPLGTVLKRFLEALRGRIPLVHHAPLDIAFLARALAPQLGGEFPAPVIDTLALEQHWRQRRNQTIGPGELRLMALREHYGLPPVSSHNALGDALATAELLLAMASGRNRHLGDLLV